MRLKRYQNRSPHIRELVKKEKAVSQNLNLSFDAARDRIEFSLNLWVLKTFITKTCSMIIYCYCLLFHRQINISFFIKFGAIIFFLINEEGRENRLKYSERAHFKIQRQNGNYYREIYEFMT